VGKCSCLAPEPEPHQIFFLNNFNEQDVKSTLESLSGHNPSALGETRSLATCIGFAEKILTKRKKNIG